MNAKLILSLLKRDYIKFIVAIFLSALSAAAGVSVIAFINEAISRLSVGADFPITLFFALIFLLFGLSYISQSQITRLGHRVVYELRLSISRRLMNMSVERIDQLGQPTILATLTKDITAISQAFNSLPFVVFGASVVLFTYAYLFWLSATFFIATLVMSTVSIIFGRRLMIASRDYKKRVRENDDVLFDSYDAMLRGRNELKLSQERRTSFYHSQLEPSAEQARVLDTKADRLNVLNGSWINTSVLLLIALVLLMHTQFQIGTSEQVTGYALAILFLRSPLAGFVGSLPALIIGSVAYAKVSSLDLAEDKNELNSLPALQASWKTLQLNQIEYDYPSEDGESGFSVGPINLTINQGELIFWVGGNGSGKSTCARLLTGLYRAHRGTITFSDTVINEHNIDWYRNHFSVVFADFYLFKNIINENGVKPDPELVEYYLTKLALNNKVEVVDGRLSTTELSQGQRKRLALLLAYLEDRSIIVLDEWAADQDPTFRRIFYTELLPELKARGKTIIAITHDDHYFHLADKLYRIDTGQLSLIKNDVNELAMEQAS
ncbi:cyclic peptide export ABC transporter [Moritella sp. 28]|uniref:cyclic peptide export ABC transporter n=1 Tax=Moritella sp. 28 TaxID=2746232 RepID=UPI001BAA87C0|nr:cyclic peptide export ABC transporter [Moritella sp. 28]QUM84281.1 cyclic peptide export ABC transporter [Moritella sp. 28]